MDIIVWGADTETYHGTPMTLQFFSDDIDENECIWVDEYNATDAFFQWCDSVRANVVHVVYVHNLGFDLPEFLWTHKVLLASTDGTFDFECGEWHISGVYGAPTFCKLVNKKRGRKILIVDSYLWFQGSLAQAAKMYCPDLPKLKHPEGLGTKLFPMSDNNFHAYAMRDAEVAYHIGKSVQRMITEYDIAQPVSLADMSAKIFRRRFLVHTIPQPNNSIMKGALRSYHGGKNNCVPGAAPAWHMDVTSLDISSAYPYAMSQLPSMSYEKLYKPMPKKLGTPKSVPDLGVYCVTGKTTDCDWPVLFRHAFQPIRGTFANVWVQGYELNEAIRSGEVKIRHMRGTYYDQEKDNRESPFKEYVDHFYALKQTEKDPVKKYGYKLNLNSVYGKFIQTKKVVTNLVTDCDTLETTEVSEVIAGGMFHPFIASAITAHTRAYIHQIEHKHKAIHTATDGIYTKCKRPKLVPLGTKKGLGSLTIEHAGDLALFRNKCYILFSDSGKIKSQSFKNKRIAKFAKHGFQGSIFDLEKMASDNTRRYKVHRPNRLKESIKRGLVVNDFVTRPMVLKVGKLKIDP